MNEFCVVFLCLFPFYTQNEWVLCCIQVFIPFLHPKWMSFVLYSCVYSLFTPKMNEFCVVFRCLFPFYTHNEWVLCCIQVFIPFLHPKWMSFVLYAGVYSLFTPKMNEFCVVCRCLFPFYTQNEWVLCCMQVFIPFLHPKWMSFVLYAGVYSLFTPKMNEFCVVFRCLFPFYTHNEWVLCCIQVFIPFLYPKWMSFVLYSGVYSLFTPKMNEFCVVFRCLFPFYTQNEWVLCCIQVFIPFLQPKWMSFVLYSGITP